MTQIIPTLVWLYILLTCYQAAVVFSLRDLNTKSTYIKCVLYNLLLVCLLLLSYFCFK